MRSVKQAQAASGSRKRVRLYGVSYPAGTLHGVERRLEPISRWRTPDQQCGDRALSPRPMLARDPFPGTGCESCVVPVTRD
ncbi:hypothetical protein Atai01_18630 [Amycolatopsis taiwanensis]|uniref:Uncharacterized protein n=1 Tax=Amycolatopsis taiwanensis TaxID=342230 RepID=A0A9W6VFU5_9PSEU|nr:hypothetical protein Atai01_18630 [Amycolatopsis taiwanensis]